MREAFQVTLRWHPVLADFMAAHRLTFTRAGQSAYACRVYCLLERAGVIP